MLKADEPPADALDGFSKACYLSDKLKAIGVMVVGAAMGSRWVGLIAAVGVSISGAAYAQTAQPVYVLSQDATGANDILVVTPAATTAQPYSVATFRTISGTPSAIGVVGSGTTAFVHDQTANTISSFSLIDPTAAPRTITGLSTPESSSTPGSTDTLYIANGATNTLSVVPMRGPTVDTIAATISGFNGPRGVLALTEFTSNGSFDRVYVANFSNNTVSVVTGSGGVATGISTTIPVDAGPTRLAYGGGMLFVANSTANDISVIDPVGLTVTTTITGINQPNAMFLSPQGTTLYVVAAGDNAVDIIPLTGPAAYSIAATIPVGRGATNAEITTDGNEAYVLNTTDNSISVLSLVTNSVTQTITGLGTVKSMAIGAAPTTIVGAVLPGSRSVQQGNIATVFATMINAGENIVSACRINLPTQQSAPLTLTATTTDPTTNAVIGIPNEPVDLTPGVPQTFLLSFQASAVTSMTTQPLQFFCEHIAPATYVPGVNSVDLAFGATATADVIALAATSSNDGIVRIPLSSNGAGAFAVASANVGATGALTVTADFGGASLPVSTLLCQTDPTSGQCLAPPAASVPVTITANATPTFSIFATAGASVAASPAANRIFVRFLDSQGVSHGSTSVAVQTN